MKPWVIVPAICLALTVCGTGCAADETNRCPPVTTLNEPKGWQTGKASFRAERHGEEIRVTATGEVPTTGYQVRLVREPAKIFPPRFVIYVKRPEGMAAQVITPFTVCASFRSRQAVERITVRDSSGAKQVDVRPGT
jgi:hypothetical protein